MGYCWILGFLLLSFICVFNLSTACVGFTAINGYRNGPYVAFKNQVTNLGAEFKPRYGTFRANKAGLYFFTFSAISDNNQAYRVTLRKNRTPVVAAFSSQAGYSSASTSAVLYLVPGDLVYLYVEEGNIYEFSKGQLYYTSFSGFLIACDGFDVYPYDDNKSDGGRQNRGGYNGGSFGNYEGDSQAGVGVAYSPGVSMRSGRRSNGTRSSTESKPAVIENLGEVDGADKIFDLLKE